MDVKDEHLEAHLADPAHPPSIEPWSDVYHDNVQPPRATHDSGAPVQLEVNHVPVHQAEIIDDPGPPVQEAQTMDDLGPAPDDELPVSKRGRGIRQNRSLSPPSSEEGNTEVLLKGKKN
ncbi:hypothetical protein MJO28_012298 [Puccinia striiformis f. sp. tritici]|uniref:Uncharacterized protein n=3 Tax=Puccinia striiformis TaxID=27350 RepID=A0A2S4WJW6_9BASI|nr:hypothetical protein Pst134EA_022825 [Puccinia striiformis f. sp. tritici]KAI9605955.1 hypothetical protein H4Q26_004326 [Puccinia striiformis f. sp. tritici PST-130]POW04625.1 hypothetical protein PSTT_10271 [Puccinia striiformis]KAH9445848.1 hypothetical protein Pst134EB_023681 [Puccinia striiformis f. sp. tritici]KAH9455355.1 hypothetical protein Pst134EA_022825 [Puccinia striiformis f. sp. tritici]KAI7942271.1 hypothetical protein MJO28_012298 [Puccinia striiformis f. sp. tritici]